MESTLSVAPKNYCPDCGPMAVSHAAERWSIRFDTIFGYLTKPPEWVWGKIKPAVGWFRPGRIAPPLLRAAAALKLGKIIDRPDGKENLRARVIWEEAEKRGIVMREFRPFGLPRDVFFATYGNDSRLFDGLPRPRTAHETSINWMDDKGIILDKFRAAGVPVPRGQSCTTLAQAEKVFNALAAPVIVKPAIGSRSRHTFLHITDIPTLHKAFLSAKELSPRVVVEEELQGFVFRITLVDGKVAGVIRREPPHVMGDGKHSVQELFTEENKNPLRQGPIFHILEIDPPTLAEQHLTLTSVPEKDRMVILHPKVSRTFGASNTEIENIHPENKKLFLKIAQVLDDPIVGIDFIMEDAGKPWQDQKCGVIECNSLPFIDLHHYPLRGPAQNVAGLVWDLTFPNSGQSSRLKN